MLHHILASSDAFLRVTLPSFPSHHKYISFTHHVKPVQKHLSDAQQYLINRIQQSRGLQHRGYVIYKAEASSIGSVVHGNFGGIALSKTKYTLSAIMRKRIYNFTSAYSFSRNDQYHLVFNNPTATRLRISVTDSGQDDLNICKLILPPLGTEFLSLTGYEGTLTVKSSMPLCRPTVFKNPDQSSGFDVFHP